jgi:hypothetical protein
MSWKIGLDRYLTTPPDDGFSNWCEDLLGEKISDDFYEKNEDWLLDQNGTGNKWINKLFFKDFDTTQAAKIIERAHKMFILNKETK